MNQLIIVMLLMVFLISGCGATVNMQLGTAKLLFENYDGAIDNCMNALESNRSQDKPTFLTEADYQVNLDFYSTMCLGAAYMGKKDYENAKKNFIESSTYFPQLAQSAYLNLAKISYLYGDLEGAVRYSQLAKNVVESRGFQKIVNNRKSVLSKKIFMAEKKQIIAAEQYYRMRRSYKEMIWYYDIGNYKKAIDIGKNILNTNFEVHHGFTIVAGETINSIEEGSIVDINGMVSGDKILEVNGIKFNISLFSISEMENIIELLSHYGTTVDFKIERKERIIPLSIRLSYPEVDATKNLIREATFALSTPQKNRKKIAGPWLKVLEPKSARGIKINGTEKTAFRILASDLEPVRDVTVNGVSCSAQEPDLLEKTMLPGKIRTFTIAMPLSHGENTFEIVAINKRGRKISQKISINGSTANSKDFDQIYKRRVAVVIGINKYNPWPSLENAVRDAESVRNKLKKMGYDKIIELYDRQATRAAILRVLGDDLPKMLGDDDSLLVYFAGHGATETLKDDQEGYIIPVDGTENNYRGAAISMSSIHDIIKRYKAKHILFVFDSCYSGLGLKRGGGKKPVDGLIKNMSQKKVRQILTAGGKDEQVDDGKGHSPFTLAFLDGLDIQNKSIVNDGYVLASDLGQFVRKQVGEKTQFKQTPLFGRLDGEGDYIFDLK